MTSPAPDYGRPEVLEDVLADVLERARRRGVDTLEAAASSGEGLSVTVRNGEAETVEHQRDKALAITVYDGGRKGTATTSDFGAEALEETIAAAAAIAAHAEPDPHAGLADPGYLAREVPDLDLDHPWELDAEAAIAVAAACEAAAIAAEPAIKQSDGCSANRYRGTRAYANTHGFSAAYRGTRHSLSAVMIAADAGGMQRGYWYDTARDAATLEDAASIGETAARRTVARLGARKIPTTTLPVLYEARVAASLIGHLLSAISGSAQYRRASFLLDALGEAVLPDTLSLVESPLEPRALGSAPFDDDGVATREQAVVRDGRLETYLLSAYSARRLGREPTGHAGGVHNLALTPGTRALEDIIAGLDRALLVTDLMGFGVNTVTGDYSRGANGFLIENGAIAHAVEEVTVAGNLRDILAGIEEVGADVDRRANVLTGSLLINRMAVAGA